MPDEKTEYSTYVKAAMGEGSEDTKAYADFCLGKSHVLMPITYISPNYFSLRSLALAASLTRLGNKVSIVLNDNNISSHKSVLQNNDALYYMASGRYVQQTMDQMMEIISIFMGNLKDVEIVKASDIWFGITGDYLQFIDFYRLLGKLRIYSDDLGDRKFDEAYHILEKPFDAFLFHNYASLAKSAFGSPQYLLLDNKNPDPYRRAAALISGTESAKSAKERILSTRMIPVLQHDDVYPGCYMELGQINKLLNSIGVSKSDADEIYKFFITPVSKLLKGFGKVVPEPKKIGGGNDLGKDLHTIFYSATELIRASQENREMELKISSPLQANNVRRLLSSKRIVQLLKYCDGEHTIAEIAKKEGLQLSNTSFYINKLREAGLISADRHPRLLISNIVFPLKTLIL